jgi:hypothetical protein
LGRKRQSKNNNIFFKVGTPWRRLTMKRMDFCTFN